MKKERLETLAIYITLNPLEYNLWCKDTEKDRAYVIVFPGTQRGVGRISERNGPDNLDEPPEIFQQLIEHARESLAKWVI